MSSFPPPDPSSLSKSALFSFTSLQFCLMISDKAAPSNFSAAPHFRSLHKVLFTATAKLNSPGPAGAEVVGPAPAASTVSCTAQAQGSRCRRGPRHHCKGWRLSTAFCSGSMQYCEINPVTALDLTYPARLQPASDHHVPERAGLVSNHQLPKAEVQEIPEGKLCPGKTASISLQLTDLQTHLGCGRDVCF